MRIFIYEYTCATGRAAQLGPEGRAILMALLDDFARIPGVEPITLIHPELSVLGFAHGPVYWTGTDEPGNFRQLAAESDWTLVVAPEFDGLLLNRCRWVEQSGGRLLGPSADAVVLAGDKLTFGRRLRDRGVPTPPCFPDRPKEVPADAWPVVRKPRYGAGSIGISCHACAEGWPDLSKEVGNSSSEFIVQPFVPGRAVSISFLLGPKARLGMPPADQMLSDDGHFHYLGGRLPLPGPLASRARSLAEQAVAALEGLRGYVGVDLVLGESADGADDRVIEVNPRMTTSYLGLRRLAVDSLANTMIRLASMEDVTSPQWRSGEIAFRADGTVT